MRLELGDSYVERLRHLFGERISNNSDLVCYWFEKARAQIADGEVQRAGLIATNSIRGGANRQVLERIKETGGIFMAWADKPWILDGAAVRVSIIAFDDGTETTTVLNGKNVANINADLTSRIDLSPAQRLPANQGKSFMGVKKVGAFDIPGDLAREWLNLPNPSGVNNADVVRPTANGMDLLRRSRDIWTIDFAGMPLEEARQYVVPMAYVESEIRPYREQGRDRRGRTYWWQHLRYRPEMHAALAGQARYLATSAVAKHRVFAWLPIEVLADGALFAFATDDDYTFGVLHSRIHEVWALAQGTELEDRPRYTPSTCFETFPFPDATPEQRDAVAAAAKHLDAVRNHLLQADEKLTMTNLYNELVELKEKRDSTAWAFPLLLAHESLDEAVAAAYGWEWPLVDEEILERLLALNLAQAGQSERAGA